MVVITGRPAAEIAPAARAGPPLEVWGLHGAERLYPDGRRELEEVARREESVEELREQLRRDSFGGLFEDKPNAAVMHWRGHYAQEARRSSSETRALFEPLAQMDGLSLLEFESGVELRAGRDKGGAAESDSRRGWRAEIRWLFWATISRTRRRSER